MQPIEHSLCMDSTGASGAAALSWAEYIELACAGILSAMITAQPGAAASIDLQDGLLYLTKLRCTPSPRCLPLHSRHMNIPYDTDAHCGFLVLQSTQVCNCQRVLDHQPAF